MINTWQQIKETAKFIAKLLLYLLVVGSVVCLMTLKLNDISKHKAAMDNCFWQGYCEGLSKRDLQEVAYAKQRYSWNYQKSMVIEYPNEKVTMGRNGMIIEDHAEIVIMDANGIQIFRK